MKLFSGVVAASLTTYVAARNDIREVITKLEGMVSDNEQAVKDDRKAQAEYKCYCDANEEEVTTAIEQGEERTALLSANIEKLQGSSGKLSMEVADLTDALARNAQEQKEAKKVRKDQNEAYKAAKADFEAAQKQVNAAIATLNGVGADLTADDSDQAGNDANTKLLRRDGAFLSKGSVIKMGKSMKQALRFASALVEKKSDRQTLLSFLDTSAPQYSTQSGAVMGILKNMADTFIANLEDALATETAQQTAHDKLIETKEEERINFEDLKEKAETKLGENDTELADRESRFKKQSATLASNKTFKEELVASCKESADAYQARKTMRAGEAAALSQALAILSSDAASDTFDDRAGIDSTGFIQVHRQKTLSPKQSVVKSLLSASKKVKSLRLASLAAKVGSISGMQYLFKAIDKMIENIEAEADSDKAQYDDCAAALHDVDGTKYQEATEKGSVPTAITDAKNTIDDLKADILQLEGEISDAKTDLGQAQTDLSDNQTSQETATKDRADARKAFEENVANLDQSTVILNKAIEVLTAHFDKQAEHEEGVANAFIQQPHVSHADKVAAQAAKDERAAMLDGPSDAAIEKKGEVQGDSAKVLVNSDEQGKVVIGMLEGLVTKYADNKDAAILEEMGSAEGVLETSADYVAGARLDYENLMESLKETEKDLKDSIKTLKATITKKDIEREEAESQKRTTEDELGASEALKKAREEGGCTFINENFDTREANRKTETDALKSAVKTLKGSAAFKNKVRSDEVASFGECKEHCVDGTNNADCQACLAGVSVKGFCTNHADTPGC